MNVLMHTSANQHCTICTAGASDDNITNQYSRCQESLRETLVLVPVGYASREESTYPSPHQTFKDSRLPSSAAMMAGVLRQKYLWQHSALSLSL